MAPQDGSGRGRRTEREIALEVAVVNRVKAHDRRVEPGEGDGWSSVSVSAAVVPFRRSLDAPDISLGQPATNEELAAVREEVLESVERLEEDDDILLVRLLRRRKARLVLGRARRCGYCQQGSQDEGCLLRRAPER
jgi:hypothetical protein